MTSKLHLKVAILGLQNAGKTSILKTLSREFESLVNIKPTFGIERNVFEFFGQNFSMWDYGGQVTYREKYLQDPARYFSLLSAVFFIVDIQDEGQFTPCYEYFHRIVENLQKFSPKTHLHVLLHKADPLLLDSPVLREKREALKDTLFKIARDGGFKPQFFDTSVYDIMSIIKAFSRVILKREEFFPRIHAILKTFSEKNGTNFALLFSRNLLEIGTYRKPNINWTELHAVLVEYFEKIDDNTCNIFTHSLHEQDYALVSTHFKYKFGNTSIPFYFIAGLPLTGLGPDETSSVATILSDKIAKLANNVQKVFSTIKFGELLHLTRV